MGVSGGSSGGDHNYNLTIGNITLANGNTTTADRAARRIVKSAADMMREASRDDYRTGIG